MSPAKIIKIDPLKIQEEYIREAADVLKSGGLVIIPTETVYGLAASMLDNKALDRLFEIKKRPRSKPFSIAIEKKERVEELAQDIPPAAYKLMHKFWPGPLTLILKGINQSSVGLRMPDNAIALKVIAAVGYPLALPSANLSGKAAPLNFAEAIRDLGGLVELAIDAGPVKLGLESSIVDFTVEPPQVLRIGAISQDDITKVIQKKNILFVCTGNTCRSVIAEALFKKMLREQHREDVEVFSAGVTTLSGIGPSMGAREVLAREGIDVSGHISQEVTKELVRSSDLILVMEKMHEGAIIKLAPDVKNRVFLLKEFAKIDENNLDISDPVGRPQDNYEQIFISIKEALERVSKLI
ncbi:MAG: L-threonylcarbamoyladenylate synthase [Candidatus Omnitrophica bacterium]|nr:L-threonylcarbamoyladenylate synthase [Candidatus Omnitrophota bacterium]